jgi:hypothetical protein
MMILSQKRMEIHTDNVLLTSLTAIELVDLHKEVKISINGDKVQDAGGLLREWVHMITKEIFEKNTGKKDAQQYDKYVFMT